MQGGCGKGGDATPRHADATSAAQAGAGEDKDAGKNQDLDRSARQVRVLSADRF